MKRPAVSATLLVALSTGGALGCGAGSPKTGRLDVTVELDSALMLSTVRLDATAEGKPALTKEFSATGQSSVQWTVQASNPGAGLLVNLQATGVPAMGGPVTFNATARVKAGQTVDAILRLTKECATTTCPSDQTCDRGICIQKPTFGGTVDAGVSVDRAPEKETGGGNGDAQANDSSSGPTSDAGGVDATCASTTEPKNCAACGHDCTALPNVAAGAAGVECRAGTCFVPAAACEAGFGHCSTRADDGCEANLTDAQSCGACATKCTGAMGLCSMTATDPKCVAMCASPTPDLCSSSCVDLKADPKNCGSCGHDCGALPNVKPGTTGIECRAGACIIPVAACSAGFGHCSTRADDGCEADLRTPDHCGSCTNICAAPAALCSTMGSTPTCSSSCTAPSPDLCVSKCVDLKSDPMNCGACNHNCTLLPGIKSGATGIECRAGVCYVPPSACSTGKAHCSTNADDGCEADLTTPAHCGSCSLVCSGATPLCSTQSQPATCLPSCAGTSPDLCGTKCVNRMSDVKNCGTCGHDCTLLPNVKPGATAPAVQCVAGACVLQPAACVSGFGHCSTNAEAGCEADLTRPQTCGSCTNVCAAPTALCSTTSGTPTCSSSCTTPNPDLCGSKCVDRKTDPTNCGTCGHDCTALPNLKAGAAVTCNASGGCVIPQSACATGWATCSTGTNDTDGCETATTTLTNCGGCGVTCSQPNATATCTTGTCAIATCNSGFDDCTTAAGCETAVNTAQNCGRCGVVCSGGTPACSGGACVCASPKVQACGTGASAMCCTAPSDPNSMISCAAGTSCATQCKTGFHACNGSVSPCYGDPDVQHCSGGCLDCRQPNANPACGAISATQCANTCVGTTLACPGVATKPTCGSWDFESQTTEGWINFAGADGQAASFAAKNTRASSGSYSLGISHNSPTTAGEFTDVLIDLCAGHQGLDLTQRRLSAYIYLDPGSSNTGALNLAFNSELFVWMHNGTDHATDAVVSIDLSPPDYPTLPVREWVKVTTTATLQGVAGTVTALEIKFRTYNDPFVGTVFFDNVRIE